MPISRSDVVAKAYELFGEKQAALALSQVEQYGTESHEPEVDRVRLEILEVSEGKAHRLPYFVKCAKIDYRDVLTGARLPAMSEEQEAAWLEDATRRLATWNADS